MTAPGFLDFTKEPLPAPLPPSPTVQSYDPNHAREKTRTWLAASVFSLFGVMIVGPYVLLGAKILTLAEVKELLGIQFGSVATIAGSALGFYFGTKSKND